MYYLHLDITFTHNFERLRLQGNNEISGFSLFNSNFVDESCLQKKNVCNKNNLLIQVIEMYIVFI